MGKVIPVEFGRRKPVLHVVESSAASESEHLSDTERVIAEDVLWIMQDAAHRSLVRLANAAGDEMTTYVFDRLGLVKKDESLQLRQESLKAISLEQLCAWLVESGQSQWRAKPHYYGAIFVEVHERIGTLNAYLDELGADKIQSE